MAVILATIELKDALILTGMVLAALAGLVLLIAFIWWKFIGAKKAHDSEDFQLVQRAADGWKQLYEQSETQNHRLTQTNSELVEALKRTEQELREAKDELQSAQKQIGKLLGRIDEQEGRISQLERMLNIEGKHEGTTTHC